MRFVPMDFGLARPIAHFHKRDTFEFSPPTRTKLPLQSHNLADASADGEGLDFLDVADDLKEHRLIIHPFRLWLEGNTEIGSPNYIRSQELTDPLTVSDTNGMKLSHKWAQLL